MAKQVEFPGFDESLAAIEANLTIVDFDLGRLQTKIAELKESYSHNLSVNEKMSISNEIHQFQEQIRLLEAKRKELQELIARK